MSSLAALPKAVEDALLGLDPASRRNFLKGSGALVFTSGCRRAARAPTRSRTAVAAGPYADPDFLQLDTWIVIHPDNTATFYVGKTDGGQGTGTAFRQMMCDELDIAYDKTQPRHGLHRHHAGPGRLGWFRRDRARRLADAPRGRRSAPRAAGTGRPASGRCRSICSPCANATIALKSDPSRKVTYAELIGGKRFNVALTGRNVDATTGQAAVKPVNELRVVGQPLKRYDIPGKVDGSLKWAVDMKLPGMVHARNVRPPLAGATLQRIDESSVANVPGFLRVVSRGNYVAVVCEREEQAIRAARQLKVEWKKPADRAVPGFQRAVRLHARARRPLRPVSPRCRATRRRRSPQPRASSKRSTKCLSRATRPSVPAHALADPSNGQMTIYSNDMKAYGLRNGVATIPRHAAREGARGLHGRTRRCTAAPRPTMPASKPRSLRKEMGRPVRLQWMRDEETAWDTKGPPYVFKLRGGLDAQGKVVALEYDACAADHNHLGYNEPDTVLIAQLMGERPERPAQGQRRDAVRDVRHSQPSHDDARRRPADDLGNAAAHRQPARPQRAAGDLRVRIVHRRTGRGRARPIPCSSASTCWRSARKTLCSARRARSPWCRPPRRPMAGMRGRLRKPRKAACAVTCSPVAASPTPIAATPLPPRSPRSRSNAAPGASGSSAWSAPTTAAS